MILVFLKYVSHWLGFYADARRKKPLSTIHDVTTNQNCVGLYWIDARLKKYIYSMFVSNYFVYRQKINFTVSLN